MPSHLPSLLSRLRRHRGLWAVAALVLLFKLASSAVCLGDSAVLAQAEPGTAAVAVASAASVPDASPCLLGEAECHCACAHALPVPAAAPALMAAPLPATSVLPAADSLRITRIDSPLRPPIA